MYEKNKKRKRIFIFGAVVLMMFILISGATATFESGQFWSRLNGDTLVLTNISNNVNIGQNATTTHKLRVYGDVISTSGYKIGSDVNNVSLTYIPFFGANLMLISKNVLIAHNLTVGRNLNVVGDSTFDKNITVNGEQSNMNGPVDFWNYTDFFDYTSWAPSATAWFGCNVTFDGDNTYFLNYNRFLGSVDFRNDVEFNDTVTFNENVTFNKKVFVDNKEVGFTPIGCIIMWSGLGGKVPYGYAICDGQTVNGYVTPDLRGRFIVGNNSNSTTFKLNTTGGENTTTGILRHAHTINTPTGVVRAISYTTTGTTGLGSTAVIKSPLTLTYSTSTDNYGTGSSLDNKPPYYALCYLMFVGY